MSIASKVSPSIVYSSMFVGGLLAAAIVKAQSQAPTPQPSFEVASIRPNHTGERIMLFQPSRGGRFTANNCSLRLLIQYAFDVMPFQISGAPDWVRSERYDIAAKAASDAEFRDIQLMLQQLIKDRFQLRCHWDSKEAAVYNLVVSKAGMLKEAAGDCSSSPGPRSRPVGTTEDTPCGSWRNTPGQIKADKLTAADLVGAFSFFLGRSVVDKTHLTGKYNIDLQWTPGEVELSSLQSGAGPASSVDAAPSIFTAVRDQLGLKLETAKGPVRTLVVDHVDRPSPN